MNDTSNANFLNFLKEGGTGLIKYFNHPKKEAKDFLIESIKKEGEITENTLKQVALIYGTRKIIKRAKNYYKILEKADAIIESESKDKSKYEPDEEWMEWFEDLSSRISNEEIQKMWARILAREIIEPNYISKVMLNTLSLLDMQSATVFSKLCSLSYNINVDDGRNHTMPLILYDVDTKKIEETFSDEDALYNEYFENYESFCPTQDELQYLSELGLIKLSESNMSGDIYSRYKMTLQIEGNTRVFKTTSTFDDENNLNYFVYGQVSFTKTGLAIANTLKIEKYFYLDFILEKFIEYQGSEYQISDPL